MHPQVRENPEDEHAVILELDYVRPLDRPGRGWLWQFNLTPGF